MARLLEQMKALLKRITPKMALIAYAGLITVVAGGLFVALIMTTQANNTSSEEAARKQKARDTQLALYDRPPLTPEGDKLYFPEVKVAIPSTVAAQTLLYRSIPPAFASGGKTNPQGLAFASKQAIYNTSKAGSSDQCGVLAEVSFGQKFVPGTGHDYQFYKQIALSDGRVMFIYQNKAACTQEWGDLDSATAVYLLTLATVSK